jgi:hypothetical protein
MDTLTDMMAFTRLQGLPVALLFSYVTIAQRFDAIVGHGLTARHSKVSDREILYYIYGGGVLSHRSKATAIHASTQSRFAQTARPRQRGPIPSVRYWLRGRRAL